MSRQCNQDKIKARCSCTYEPCQRKGYCCDCIEYHRRMNQLPGCVFPPEAERTYDRSMRYFAKLVQEGKIG